jgi:putative Holliday junction resolvase
LGRILALDLGERRIGLALSDELRLTAQGLPTLVRTNLREDLSRVSEVAAARGANLILLGNPVRMSGLEGARSAWVRQFAEKLEARSGLAVQLWDERLTTVEAERVLRLGGVSREKRKRAVDRLAAVILLQSYLESVSAVGGPGDPAG